MAGVSQRGKSSGGSSELAAYTITGNGVLLAFPVAHNFNNEDVLVQVKDTATNKRLYPKIEGTPANMANSLTVTFTSPPANGATYKVLVDGKKNSSGAAFPSGYVEAGDSAIDTGNNTVLGY